MSRRRVLLAVSLLALAGCATQAAVRYYTLTVPAPAQAPPAAPAPAYRVAIGPVSVPEALDRLQIVLRVAPNRYAISDFDRWSEPLKREIPRVLAEEVAQRLPAARTAAPLQHGGHQADYRVPIDVLRFESVPGESITLEAAWSVRNGAGERLREAHSVIVEPVAAAGVTPLVRAHAKALAALAAEIASALDAVAPAKR